MRTGFRARAMSGDGAGRSQLGDLVGREAELPEDGVGVDARVRVRVAGLGDGATEAGRGRDLATTVGRGHEEVAGDVVRVLVRLAEAVDGREADVGARELRLPLRPRLRAHGGGDAL